jgi:hypothetical protein
MRFSAASELGLFLPWICFSHHRYQGSTSGQKMRLIKNQEVHIQNSPCSLYAYSFTDQMVKSINVAESDEQVPYLSEKRVVSIEESSQTQPMVRKSKVGRVTESLQTQPTVQKAKVTSQPVAKKAKIMEEQIDNPEEVISSYSEHFKYIATMTSFEDSRFKHTIVKELLNDRNKSWKAFKALSPTSV